MKVKTLIEWLRTEDPEAEVVVAYNYGDRNRTTVAPGVGRVEATLIRDSEYFRRPIVVDEDDNEDDLATDPTVRRAVVIFSRGT